MYTFKQIWVSTAFWVDKLGLSNEGIKTNEATHGIMIPLKNVLNCTQVSFSTVDQYHYTIYNYEGIMLQ